MLRKIRIILAALCFVCITLLFVGIGNDWWGVLAKLQVLPAVTRLIGGATLGNIAVVSGILLVTLLFGRIYCSVLCPLGVFQDLIIRLRRMLGKRFRSLRKVFHYNYERRYLRYAVAAAMISAIVVDLQILVSLLGPYSAYGRMVRSVVGGGPAPLLIAAGVTFVVIVLFAWFWGRAWCNNICPVGTVLGCFSKFSLFRIRIDEDKCVGCGACATKCRASCIDERERTVDGSRCVDCFDCIGNCKTGAISFRLPRSGSGSASLEAAPKGSASLIPPTAEAAGPSRETAQNVDGWPKNAVPSRKTAQNVDGGRRAFLKAGAALVSGATATVIAGAQEMKLDGGLAPLEAKRPIDREPRLVPPGSQSVKNFYDKCTACQLCVANCPNGVLRPSTDPDHLLQPQMGYEKGYCRPECTACSEVCPTGAILPVKREAKTLIHIGVATVNTDLCLAAKGEAGCGKCARECPTGAITMVTADGVRRPAVAEEQCIGCGKCEYLCPSRPVSAITVQGIETHRNG